MYKCSPIRHERLMRGETSSVYDITLPLPHDVFASISGTRLFSEIGPAHICHPRVNVIIVKCIFTNNAENKVFHWKWLDSSKNLIYYF